MTTTHAAEIPLYPMARAAQCPFDPPPAQQALLTGAPLSTVRLPGGDTAWLVTRHADQKALLADPRISADMTRPGYPHDTPESKAAIESGATLNTFATMDDPEHARLRRMVTAPFTVKRVAAMRPAVQRIADELIDAMLAGPQCSMVRSASSAKSVDLVEAFALPLPSLVISELLGVPYDDHAFFQDNSKIIISRTSTVEQRGAAVAALARYLGELVGAKMANPADDLLSRLVTERVATGELSATQAAQMGVVLLIAGHETTANMIALGTLALLEHPDQLALLRDSDDPALVAGAVEELLRYLTIAHGGRRRVAVADIEFGDQVIRAGEAVIFSSDSGNRDPEAFPGDPDRLDLRRQARHHVAFGFGVHQCLGQPLARMELQVAYSTLYRRIPTLALAGDVDQLPFKHDGFVYGVHELPVTW